MKWFYNLRIASKLIITFLLVALIAGVVGIVGLTNILSISEADTLLFEHNAKGISYSSNAARYYQRLKYNIAEIILLEDDSLRDSYVTNLNSYLETIDQQIEKYKACISSEDNREIYDRLTSQWTQYRAYLVKVIQHIQYGQYALAEDVLLGEADKIGDEVRETLVELVEYNQDSAAKRNESNTEIANTAVVVMIIIIAAGIIIAILLGLFISSTISKPIKNIVVAANKLAEGDMDLAFDAEYKDETGQLINAFKNLVASTKEQALLV